MGVTNVPVSDGSVTAVVTVAVGPGVAVVARTDGRIDGLTDGRTVGAVALGYVSHLLVDLTTPAGVALWYPPLANHVTVPLRGHSPLATATLWGCCLVVLLSRRRRGLPDRDRR